LASQQARNDPACLLACPLDTLFSAPKRYRVLATEFLPHCIYQPHYQFIYFLPIPIPAMSLNLTEANLNVISEPTSTITLSELIAPDEESSMVDEINNEINYDGID
jgi:hypothetical protein